MSLYSLYQDPMQRQPMVVEHKGIGSRMIPDSFSLQDPILLRHILVTMCVVRNFFHIYLCWRQLRLCKLAVEPPVQLRSVMSVEEFEVAKNEERLIIEQNIQSYVFDAMFSCIELYLGVFPFLWRVIVGYYSIAHDLAWQSIAYVFLFSIYMALRALPQIFYNKLILESIYEVKRDKTMPLVGILCTLTLLVVLVQVVLIPLTSVFLFIESFGGRFFVLWIWGFLFAVSLLVLMVCNLYGIPFIGRKFKLPEGALRTALEPLLLEFKFPTDCIYIVRSLINNPTAYAWGWCCAKHVVIMESLMYNQGRQLSELEPDLIGRGLLDDELVAYVAHELAHYRHLHPLKIFCMVHATLIIYLILFGTCYRVNTLYEAAGFDARFYPPIIGYWLVYKYVMPLYLTITNWIIFYFTRKFELSADRYAAKLGYGSMLVAAVLKLLKDNLVFPYVDPWYLRWHRVRPSTYQRVKELLPMRSSARPDI